ncbi:hypothetical protein B0T24DRAFT_592348 [Lasiosphaeria ovina]|uniref:Uncharacterized protein n=1 Tax=Lasiosphaeria ovina TaxID=92902 RepID=A0AAE0KHB2_9PEZI|nr:hypothetical protein B0T24DRAFT_592348 [Lasiosphaeria ovina]
MFAHRIPTHYPRQEPEADPQPSPTSGNHWNVPDAVIGVTVVVVAVSFAIGWCVIHAQFLRAQKRMKAINTELGQAKHETEQLRKELLRRDMYIARNMLLGPEAYSTYSPTDEHLGHPQPPPPSHQPVLARPTTPPLRRVRFAFPSVAGDNGKRGHESDAIKQDVSLLSGGIGPAGAGRFEQASARPTTPPPGQPPFLFVIDDESEDGEGEHEADSRAVRSLSQTDLSEQAEAETGPVLAHPTPLPPKIRFPFIGDTSDGDGDGDGDGDDDDDDDDDGDESEHEAGNIQHTRFFHGGTSPADVEIRRGNTSSPRPVVIVPGSSGVHDMLEQTAAIDFASPEDLEYDDRVSSSTEKASSPEAMPSPDLEDASRLRLPALLNVPSVSEELEEAGRVVETEYQKERRRLLGKLAGNDEDNVDEGPKEGSVDNAASDEDNVDESPREGPVDSAAADDDDDDDDDDEYIEHVEEDEDAVSSMSSDDAKSLRSVSSGTSTSKTTEPSTSRRPPSPTPSQLALEATDIQDGNGGFTDSFQS